jgi:membrane associated rhomboid family serine protease
VHLGGNLFFLYVFGRQVEDHLGHTRYASFFCLGGAVAMLVQTYLSPFSQVPMIGASGAIAAVAGAYCMFFPNARVLTFIPIPFVFRTVRVPTVGYLLVWLVSLVASGLYLVALNGRFTDGGAWGAHLGGFIAGVVFGPLSLSFKRRNARKKRSKHWQPDSPLGLDSLRSVLRY